MKQKFWQTKEFIELEREWYLKLERDGFKDAEEKTDRDVKLRQYSTGALVRYRLDSPLVRECRQKYYELLAQAFDGETEFQSAIEQLVMKRRSSGVKIVDICKELASMRKKRHRETVSLIIQKFEKKWQIKKK